MVAIEIPVRNVYYEVYLDTGKGKKTMWEITPFVTRLLLKRSMKETDEMIFNGNDRIESLKLLNSPYLRKGATIYYRYGYVAWRMSSLRVCQVTEIKTSFEETPSFSISCSDMGVPMKKFVRTKVFYNKTASEIAKEIASFYNLKIHIEDTSKRYKSVATGNRTDFQFLKYLASREAGNFQSYLTGDDFYFYQKKNGTKSVTTYAYGDYEVFSFTVREVSDDADADSDGVKSVITDKTNGKIYSNLVSAPEKLELALGDDYARVFDANTGKFLEAKTKEIQRRVSGKNGRVSKLVDEYIDKGATGKLDIDELTDRIADVTAKEASDILFKGNDKKNTKITNGKDEDIQWTIKKASNKKAKEKNKVLEAELIAHLNPLLRLDDIVTIDNVDKRNSGNWWVWEIEDEISESGGITRVVMGRHHYVAKTTKESKGKLTADFNNTVGKPAQESTSTVEVPTVYSAKNGRRIPNTKK